MDEDNINSNEKRGLKDFKLIKKKRTLDIGMRENTLKWYRHMRWMEEKRLS